MKKTILYYGSGNCYLSDTKNIRGVQIWYNGKIQITDTTPDGYEILSANNQILIIPINPKTDLSELFSYIGRLEITRALVADNDANSVPVGIKKVLDYSELLYTKAEDMTTISEDISAEHTHKHIIGKTSINTSTINNLNTSNLYGGKVYLKDGSEYTGFFHIHKLDSAAMTGKKHHKDSEDLYIKQGYKLVPTRNPGHIPLVKNLVVADDKRRKIKEKNLIKRKPLSGSSSVKGRASKIGGRTKSGGGGRY